MERKLAAILAADVVGYSRLMAANEAETLSRLQSLLREIIEPRIHEFGGRVVKLMGDGLLADFSSTVNAVKCAAEFQQAISESEQSRHQEQRICFRVGINLGDIIIDGDDIFGDGVNVAARLEALAEPNGVCLSGTAFDTVDGKVGYNFKDLGLKTVKNITKPVRAYHLTMATDFQVKSTSYSETARASDRPSIAVLPFKNLAGDADDDYFVEGITEDIMIGLGRFREIVVAARGSSFLVGNQSLDVREAAKKLGVQYLLKGSVRRGGDRVRITASLIDGPKDHQIWSERYDRVLDGIFEVQDDVTRRIVVMLAGSIERADQARSLVKPLSDLSAYECVLRGRRLHGEWGKDRSQKDVVQAREMYEMAIEIDEKCAPAYAGLAATYLTEFERGWSDTPNTIGEQIIAFARKAIELDDDDSSAHLILASAHWQINRDWERARSQLEAAIDRNPNYYWNYCFGSWFCACAGDLALSLDHGEQAIRRNPLLPDGCLATLGYTEYLAGRYERAIANFTRMTNMHDDTIAVLAASYAQLGRQEEAAAAAAEFRNITKKGAMTSADWTSYLGISMPFKDDEPAEHLCQGLGKAGLIADKNPTAEV